VKKSKKGRRQSQLERQLRRGALRIVTFLLLICVHAFLSWALNQILPPQYAKFKEYADAVLWSMFGIVYMSLGLEVLGTFFPTLESFQKSARCIAKSLWYAVEKKFKPPKKSRRLTRRRVGPLE
jgi:hypothetical protein